jgi:peptidylprolyl isomerase
MRNKNLLRYGILLLVIALAAVLVNMVNSENKKVEIETNKGKFVIELYSAQMPITAGNFEKLVSKGFYDGVIFHRVIKGFMIQGGDPDGTGAGGPGYEIKDEFTNSELDHNLRGTLSMANAGPNTGGSQFFINVVDNNFLNGKHPVFGKIVEGMEIVDDIVNVETGANDRPVEEVKIIKAKLL